MSLKNNIIPVFYTADHLLHHPLYEYDRGQQIPYQEAPLRIEAARNALETLPFTRMIVPSETLTHEQITRVHASDLVTHLQNISAQITQQELLSGQEQLYLYPWIYPLNAQMAAKLKQSPDASGCYAFDTYAPIGKHTWQAVYSSANLAASAAQSILSGESRLAYALCRPPGHHAARAMIGGYCYLNNAAIAADLLYQSLGRGVILDIDYHHGNGTQDIFWENPEVLFVSIHADPADEYPFFSGYTDERGGTEEQTNLNIPLAKGCDDSTYLQALDQALGAIRLFQPNWLVLSAGYDTCQADPTTFFNLTDEVYSKIGNRIGMLQLPMVIIHEGGYAVEQNGALAARLLSGIVDSLD